MRKIKITSMVKPDTVWNFTDKGTNIIYNYKCECGCDLEKEYKYCPSCGSEIDWSEVQKISGCLNSMINTLDGLNDNVRITKTEYILAAYNKFNKKWCIKHKYCDIEFATLKMKQYQEMHKGCEVSIFEHIKTESVERMYIK